MNKREFLKTSDENVLNVEISDTRDENNNSEVCAFLTIGFSDKKIKERLESLTKEQIEHPKLTFQQFEVLLTKGQLQYMLKKIEKEEKFIKKNGIPHYIN